MEDMELDSSERGIESKITNAHIIKEFEGLINHLKTRLDELQPGKNGLTTLPWKVPQLIADAGQSYWMGMVCNEELYYVQMLRKKVNILPKGWRIEKRDNSYIPSLKILEAYFLFNEFSYGQWGQKALEYLPPELQEYKVQFKRLYNNSPTWVQFVGHILYYGSDTHTQDEEEERISSLVNMFSCTPKPDEPSLAYINKFMSLASTIPNEYLGDKSKRTLFLFYLRIKMPNTVLAELSTPSDTLAKMYERFKTSKEL
ncbi:hypothetical protein TRICI_003802 [Trichomonascus ciferrii]|uniref:Uncharacterized protein n=1 Tax=Trichomonascus ciferrii TaxID=44093 RepID=A0A642V2V6_9ASCO|nr:hypothetical protein TRICI_003802 [Trichomonascus ciferrii]